MKAKFPLSVPLCFTICLTMESIPVDSVVGTSCVFVEAIKTTNFIAKRVTKCLSSILKRP